MSESRRVEITVVAAALKEAHDQSCQRHVKAMQSQLPRPSANTHDEARAWQENAIRIMEEMVR